MDELTKEAIMELLMARQEVAFKKLENNVKYVEVCHEQEEREKVGDEICSRIEPSEKMDIWNYFEGEVGKTNYEIEEAYIQGLRDCFKLIGFLKGDEIRI